MEWIPYNIMISNCEIPMKNTRGNLTTICNNTSVQEIFRRIALQFSAMFKKKAFLHSFISAGMEEMEFVEGESNLMDLISEYQTFQDMENENIDSCVEDDVFN